MSAAGHRIIQGLQDATAGNFTRVTVDGQAWVRETPLLRAAPELLTACKALVAMLEDSMTGMLHPDTRLPFEVGVTDVEISPDGDIFLSDARAAIAKATGAAS
jgi:hypothetical protein